MSFTLIFSFQIKLFNIKLDLAKMFVRRTGQRVDTAVASYTYAICPASAGLLDTLSAAFTAVADPRFNGPTAQSNLAIDALPK